MGSKKTKFIAAAIFLVIAAGVAYVLVATAHQVTLTPRRFTIERYPDYKAQVVGMSEYATATIELSNTSNRTITFHGYGPESPLYALQLETALGWRARRQMVCGTGLRQRSLAPHSSITSIVYVVRDKPCRVSLAYSDGRKPSRFWERMPDWLKQRVPWGKGYVTAVSPTIDLRNTVNIPVETTPSGQ